MNIQIENYNKGIILENDFVYFHFSHELNDAENGGALFFFKNNQFENVIFSIFYEEIVDYLLSNIKYGNYINLKANLEKTTETMIEIKFPRSRVSLNQYQVDCFKEIISVFENIIKDKLILQANKKRLEMMLFKGISKSKGNEEDQNINAVSKREEIISFFNKIYCQAKCFNYKYLLLISLRIICICLVIKIFMQIISP